MYTLLSLIVAVTFSWLIPLSSSYTQLPFVVTSNSQNRARTTTKKQFRFHPIRVDIGNNLEEANDDEVFVETPLEVTEEKISDLPFFSDEDLDGMTMEQEVEAVTAAEIKKSKLVSNLRNQNGVDYAPWMNISADDEKAIKQLVKSKAEARRRRDLEAQDVQGNLFLDSQAQELSGGGLKYKVLSDSEVELEWQVGIERDTAGYIVKRRQSRAEGGFEEIRSYKSWGPLVAKGGEGNTYRYTDSTVAPGGWTYRITEVGTNGVVDDLCQALVEIETKNEQIQGVVAAVAIVLLGVGAVVAGISLDPLQ